MQITRSPIPGNFYSDTLSLKTLKKKEYYKVIAFDKYYKASPTSEIAVLNLPDVVPPQAPHLMPIQKKGDSLQLSWKINENQDVKTINIYRKYENNIWELVKEVAVTQEMWFATNYPLGESFKYAISAVDTSGLESNLSNIRHLNTYQNTLGRKPVLKGTFNSTTKALDLSWDFETDQEGYVVIYRSTGQGLRQYASVPLSEKFYSDTALFRDTQNYIYQIKAVQNNGISSSLSNQLKVRLR